MKPRKIGLLTIERLRRPRSSYCLEIEGRPVYFTPREYAEFLERRLEVTEETAERLERQLLGAVTFSVLQAHLYDDSNSSWQKTMTKLGQGLQAAQQDVARLNRQLTAEHSANQRAQGELDYRGRLLDQAQRQLEAERRTTYELRSQSEAGVCSKAELEDSYERLRAAGEELRTAIDALHGYYSECRDLSVNLEHQTRYSRQAGLENERLRSEIAAERQRETELEIQVSNLTGGSAVLGILKHLSPQLQRYAADYLKESIPQTRAGYLKIHDSAHHHHRTREFDRFLESLSVVPYATEIFWKTVPTSATRVVGVKKDGDRYFLDVAYSNGNGFGARVRVYTTAQKPLQAEFVRIFFECFLR